MDQEKYWQRFASSGKVEDYLAYRDVSRQDIFTQRTDRGSGEHERNHNSDRDDHTVITNQGI